ncbi:RhoGAP domain containing protein [Trichomonas vaginalis G3]|uniref:RhoGAP domain containing protein n=1 Tax=Trichomonas vaginalis (strain ATCC PRA-98 / G3) TaxID=412133 RepID=A2DAS1_TRIV3|nr:GTPase activator, FI04035P family [Trichomonas vaginalis G3]EAY22574.1 RhoGAP domain containing protein [Trichomonas vaginalis G3]KAI5497306.1 GTPase activator, FI04035P family [Trichomonas vaginalis G3]|eukprot:XP_001583560.1 RhoGAP domain containing protein [Trichomonas vaginalis G3]
MDDKIDLIWYEVWSSATPRPFYFHKKDEAVSWDPPADAIIFDPPDGFFCFPPAPKSSDEPEIDINDKDTSLMSRVGTLKSYKSQNVISNFTLEEETQDIFSLQVQEPELLMDIPYFPDDLFVLMSKTAIIKYLQDNIGQQFVGTLSKQEMPFDKVIKPGKKSLSGPILKNRSTSSKNVCQSLFKYIRTYLNSASESSLNDFTKLIDGNEDMLADEASVQILTELNTTAVTNNTINAWNLLLYVGSKYIVTEPIRLLIRSFCFLVATSDGVDYELKDLASICLLRFSSRIPVNFGPEVTLMEYMNICTSQTALFGFSISEILWKEHLRGVEHPDNVPQILKKIAVKLRDMNAFQHEGIFRKPGGKTEQLSMANKINNGEWEINSLSIDTVASMITLFFSRLRESVIPPDMILKMQANAPSYVSISCANSLPAEHHDTLMFFIGLLQEFLIYKSKTRMNEKNFVISFGAMLSNIPDPLSLADVATFPPRVALQRMFTNLLRFWRTTDVYTCLTL